MLIVILLNCWMITYNMTYNSTCRCHTVVQEINTVPMNDMKLSNRSDGLINMVSVLCIIWYNCGWHCCLYANDLLMTCILMSMNMYVSVLAVVIFAGQWWVIPVRFCQLGGHKHTGLAWSVVPSELFMSPSQYCWYASNKINHSEPSAIIAKAVKVECNWCYIKHVGCIDEV